jgi:WD40 repeat protein
VDVTTQEKHVIEGLYPNGNGVNVVGFSQDGQFLLTGGWGILNDQNTGLIKILRASDYSVLQTLDAHRGHSVDFLRISNDDNWLISADDSTINVWDLKEGRVKWHLPRLDSGLAFDGQRTLFLGMREVTDGLPDSNITGLRGRRRGIVFIDILEGKVTRAIASLGSELIRRIAVSSANAELVALAQTDSGYFVQVIDGKTDRIMKTISVKPYQPEPGWQLLGVPRIDFELAQNHPVVVYNDRRATYFIDYKSGKKEDFDHRSMIGFAFDRTGERFAILGGIKNQALTGQPEQDYWTVSIFSFKPVWEN